MTQSSWIGRTISDRYEIQELLGQGGMSAVYKANDPNLRRVVAVKIIHPHLSSDPEFVRRFEEEAAAVAQLRYPNLIQVYDFNHDEETYYIIFEFVPGESVEMRLKRMKTAERPMDIAEVTEIVAQTADGLQYAHTKGLIHRDIKPANIMLNVTGDPIVMDFGIAKIMGGTQHTATGAVLGTARYMSPEQIKGERIDPRTDIYSLGITLFEMLGGRPPFKADSAMTLMMMHMTDPVPNLQDLRSDVPAEMVAVVNKSLAKDREDRYQTAAEFAAALRSIGKGAAAPIVAATMFETAVPKPADPAMTVLEPVDTSSGVDTGAVALAAAAAAAGTTAPPPSTAASGAGIGAPPAGTTSSAAPPQQSGGSRTLLYAGGAAILLLLIAIGVWAIFFRGSGDDELAGGGEIPAVTVEPTETPDAQATIDAGVSTELETRAANATQTVEAIPTNTPPPNATATSTATATATATADVILTEVPVIDSVGTIDQVLGQVLMIIAEGEEIIVTVDTPITEGAEFNTGNDGQLTFTLEDGSIVQLLEDSEMSLDAVAGDSPDVNQQTNFTLKEGDLLLRQPDTGSELAVFNEASYLISTLQYSPISSGAPKQATAAKRAQQSNPDEAAMSIHLEEDIRVTISCFSGVCTTGGGTLVRPGWERIVSPEGAFISSFPITSASQSYQRWQPACDNCLPEAPAPVIPSTATPVPTATEEPLPTTEATPTETANYSALISHISLENGVYVVSYEARGYTEQLPGRHVHFYFNTVYEVDAGMPGSGPWKVYGGPRPFSQYTEADRGEATSMCIVVANPDHTIIPGTGNCFPLPETETK